MTGSRVIAFIGIAVLLLWGGNALNERLDRRAAQEASIAAVAARQEEATSRSRILVQDIAAGTGVEAKAGDALRTHYRGELLDGTKFDSSYDRGEPFEFRLGAGEVIRGWDLGLVGMRVGGTRTLVIPADLAYGDRQAGPIPPSSTLKFTVELLGVNDGTSTLK